MDCATRCCAGTGLYICNIIVSEISASKVKQSQTEAWGKEGGRWMKTCWYVLQESCFFKRQDVRQMSRRSKLRGRRVKTMLFWAVVKSRLVVVVKKCYSPCAPLQDYI